MFGKRKRDKAIDALKAQFGIDLYESGHYCNDKLGEYNVYILEGYDFIAVINRKSNGRFVAKEWYKFSKSNGWVKLATMDKQQSVQLYLDTQPYWMADELEKWGGKVPPDKAERLACAICDEYISSFMTQRYFGFSIHVSRDDGWRSGHSHTQAVYMPHRDPDPRNETPEEHAARMRRIDDATDALVAAYNKSKKR